ncbi:MAG: hypothetical protein QM820_58210 [Minicystis sp.]
MTNPKSLESTATPVAIAEGDAGGPPTISSFTAEPASVVAGQKAMLRWEILGSKSVDLSPGPPIDPPNVLVWPPSGWLQVGVNRTTTYTLTATNDAGSTTATTTLTFVGPPTSFGLELKPSIIEVGSSSTLTWTTYAVTNVVLSGPDGVISTEPNGSITIAPKQDTTYTIACSEFTPLTVTLTVHYSARPTIDRFEAFPARVRQGLNTNLFWETHGATSVTLLPDPRPSYPPPRPLPLSGDLTFFPLATQSYALTATNPAGSSAARTAVQVDKPG